MAAKLQKSFDDLVGEVEMRKSRERELQESEARLRASEERWRLVFENSTLGIMLTDHNHRFLATNRALQTMIGYTAQELRKLSPVDLIAEEEREEARRRLAELSDGQAGQLRGRDALSAKGRLADLGQHVRLDHSRRREQPADLYCHRHRHHRPAQGGKRTAAVSPPISPKPRSSVTPAAGP